MRGGGVTAGSHTVLADGGEPAAEPPTPPASPKRLFWFYTSFISSFFFWSAKRLLNAPWHSSAVQNIYFPSELLLLIFTDVITRLCFIRGCQRKCALSRFICRCVFPVEHNSRLVVISAPVTKWLPAQNIIRKCRLAAEDRLRHSDATLKLLQGKRDWPRAIYSLLIKVSDNSPPPVIC